MGIFSLVFIFLGMQDLYSIQIKPLSVDFKSIEAKNINAFDLNSSLVSSFYEADDWVRFEDKDSFSKVNIFSLEQNLSSNELLMQDDNISLKGNVFYTDVNGTRIRADEIFYVKDLKILHTDTNFTAYKDSNILLGNSLVYDLLNRQIKIEGIKLWLNK